MKTKALIVVMSHLSDAQELLGISGISVRQHINFAKYICFHVVDLSKEIDADQMWDSFIKSKTK
jgi:hypothetical protein